MLKTDGWGKPVMTLEDIISKYMAHLVSSDDFLGKIEHQYERHSGRIAYHDEDRILETDLQTAEAKILLPQDEILQYQIEAISTRIYDFCEEMISQAKTGFFSQISEIIDFAGNTFDGGGKKPDIDTLIGVFERMPMEFDDAGEPKLPTLVVPPKDVEYVKSLQPSPEQSSRLAEIIDKKREEYFATKRSRRLSG